MPESPINAADLSWVIGADYSQWDMIDGLHISHVDHGEGKTIEVEQRRNYMPLFHIRFSKGCKTLTPKSFENRKSILYVDKDLLRKLLTPKINQLIYESRFSEAFTLYSASPSIWSDDELLSRINADNNAYVSHLTGRLLSALRQGSLSQAEKIFGGLQKALEGSNQAALSVIEECRFVDDKLSSGKIEHLGTFESNLIHATSRQFLTKKLSLLRLRLDRVSRNHNDSSHLKVLEEIETYSFVPGHLQRLIAYNIADLEHKSNAVNRLIHRLQAALDRTFEVALEKIQNGLCKRPDNAQMDLDELDQQSLKLVLLWANFPRHRGLDFWSLLRKAQGNDAQHLCRLYSARQAEIVAYSFLKRLNLKPKDTSINQLTGDCSEWRTHDIECNGNFYDVKNTRGSFRSRENYTEFCVPHFKLARDLSKVNILAVFSSYQSKEQLLGLDNGQARVLGCVTALEIDSLSQQIKKISAGRLVISPNVRISRPEHFLPGWFFDLPPEANRRKSAFIRHLPLFCNTWDRQYQGNAELPKPLILIHSSVCPQHEHRDDVGFPHWLAPILAALRKGGLQLKYLVAGIITTCITEAMNCESDFQPIQIHEYIFFRENYLYPLGIYDPLSYCRSFVDTFQSIFENCRLELADFVSFRMTAQGILQGRLESGKWKTIIAHCGGWDKSRNVKCGKSPIHLGISKTCENPTCGKLICPDCGFCSKLCSECEQRQNSISEAVRSDAKYNLFSSSNTKEDDDLEEWINF